MLLSSKQFRATKINYDKKFYFLLISMYPKIILCVCVLFLDYFKCLIIFSDNFFFDICIVCSCCNSRKHTYNTSMIFLIVYHIYIFFALVLK